MREPNAEQFLKDVAAHQMTIALDSGMYRHIKFKNIDRGWNLWFDLVTWPGFLTISGDMGAWTFSRVADMFTFFRSSKKLEINVSYWAEKLQNGTSGGRRNAQEFDGDAFAKELLDQLSGYYGLEGSELEAVTAAVQEEVLDAEGGNGQHALLRAAAEFTHRDERGKVRFQFDTCELPDGEVYSYHFTWCLYAIVWGIQRYDELHAAPAQNSDLQLTSEAQCKP